MIELTKHQKDILNQVRELLKTEDYVIINGKAGTGKTTMVDELICTLNPKKCLCCAPTNKAVKVLSSKLPKSSEKYLNKLVVTTLHKGLNLTRIINSKTGDISYKPRHQDKNPLADYALLVIDETSMVGTDLLKYIEDYSKSHRIKVLFIGDPTQLNPVNEVDTPVFTKGYKEVNLLEIIRQGKDNPIIKLSRNLDLLQSHIHDYTNTDGNVKGYVFDNRYDFIVESLAEYNGTDDIKFLCWTNAEVDKMNRLVREYIYGSNPDIIMKGESIVLNAPYGKDYSTKDEIRVEKVELIEYEQELTIAGIKSTYRFDCVKVNDQILCLTRKGKTLFNSITDLLRKECFGGRLDWLKYYEFYETFADFTYNHAMTVHSSQGSTYKKAILHLKDMMKNRNTTERERLLYTAVTRASELVVVYI